MYIIVFACKGFYVFVKAVLKAFKSDGHIRVRVGTDYWIPCVCVGGMNRFVGWWNGPFLLVEGTVLEGVGCDRRVLLLLLVVARRLAGWLAGWKLGSLEGWKLGRFAEREAWKLGNK